LGLWDGLKRGLKGTRENLKSNLQSLFFSRKLEEEEFFEELESILLEADVGLDTTTYLLENLRQRMKEKKIKDFSLAYPLLKEEIFELLGHNSSPLSFNTFSPTVVMVVGVNGTGKTTTIGKLAFYFKNEGKKVLLAAADTFRAAAVEQLDIWAKRAGVEIIKQGEGADPAAVVYDSLQAAVARHIDLLLIDTAGRLQTKKNLMQELDKIKRVVSREIEGAPHEILLVLDASTGQNAISQARIFNEVTGLTGIVLTKIDGTAKGGVVLAIRHLFPSIPIKFVGTGEKIEDLEEFDPAAFTEALLGDEG